MRRAALATALAAFPLSAFAQGCPEGQRPLAHAAGETCIPEDPQRIVSLHDISVTLPLVELGVTPVGSHGRTDEGEAAAIRSGLSGAGVSFENSGMAFVSGNPADAEAVAALDPDLIVTTAWQTTDVERLSAIAPTVVLDDAALGIDGVYRELAALTGAEDRLARLQARYDANIARLRGLIEGQGCCGSITSPWDEGIQAYGFQGAVDQIFRDVGVARPAILDAIPDGERRDLSYERLPDLDGDFMLMFHFDNGGEAPDDARATLAGRVSPRWCEALHACREGQLHFLAISDTSIPTFDNLHGLTMVLSALLGGRDLARFEG